MKSITNSITKRMVLTNLIVLTLFSLITPAYRHVRFCEYGTLSAAGFINLKCIKNDGTKKESTFNFCKYFWNNNGTLEYKKDGNYCETAKECKIVFKNIRNSSYDTIRLLHPRLECLKVKDKTGAEKKSSQLLTRYFYLNDEGEFKVGDYLNPTYFEDLPQDSPTLKETNNLSGTSEPITSTNKNYSFQLKNSSGNFLLKEVNKINPDKSKELWSSNTSDMAASKESKNYLYKKFEALLTEEGEFIIRDNQHTVIWTTGRLTNKTGPFRLILTDDGKLSLYRLVNKQMELIYDNITKHYEPQKRKRRIR